MFRVVATNSTAVAPEEVAALTRDIDESRQPNRPKGILIADAHRAVAPDKRKDWFAQETIEAASVQRYCLLPTDQLFAVVSHVLSRMNQPNFDENLTALRKELVETVGVYQFRKR